MRRVLIWPATALLFAVALAGCNNVESPQDNSAAPPASAPASSEPTARLASWEEVEQLIASKKGKVVVLDLWSTWCTPCLKEFPGLVALHNKHPDQVACISLNLNYAGAKDESPADARAEIEAFLKEQGATFDNLISTTPDEAVWKSLNVAMVPIVRVYDRQGQLRKQFVNENGEYGDEGFTYQEHVAPFVEQLVKE
jgi:thiol-disulfide isomerase/thioredoxin